MREMRRKELAISKEEAIGILKECEYGILCVAGTDHLPYGVPMNYAVVDQKIYVHCASEGRKIDSIKENPKVSFTAVGEHEVVRAKFSSKYDCVIVEGSAKVIEDEAEKRVGLEALIQKYSPEHIPAGNKYIDAAIGKVTVIGIQMETVSGKHHD